MRFTRLIVVLAVSFAVLIAAILLASNAGLMRASCDNLTLNNRVGQCYVAPAASDATSVAPTPDPALYNLPSLDLKK